MTPKRVKWPGQSYPLGATFDGAGTNFALFSSVADRVELCLFVDGAEQRIDLDLGIGQIWHAYIPEVGPGTRGASAQHREGVPPSSAAGGAAGALIASGPACVHGLCGGLFQTLTVSRTRSGLSSGPLT